MAHPLPKAPRGPLMLGSGLELQRDILGFLTRLDSARGPMATFRVGPRLWVLATEAEAVDAVLRDRDSVFEKPDTLYGAGRMMLGNALTGLKGDTWRRRRAVVAPAFHEQPLDAEAVVAATHHWARARVGKSLRLDLELKPLMTEVG